MFLQGKGRKKFGWLGNYSPCVSLSQPAYSLRLLTIRVHSTVQKEDPSRRKSGASIPGSTWLCATSNHNEPPSGPRDFHGQPGEGPPFLRQPWKLMFCSSLYSRIRLLQDKTVSYGLCPLYSLLETAT